MSTENHDPPYHEVCKAEDFLDAAIDDVRAKVAAGTPPTTEALADEMMDYFEAMPIVRRDFFFMPLMASILAAVAVQRLAYREEGLEPTDDQSRVLMAIAEATKGVWVGSLLIPGLANQLDMTCDEIYRHTRALTRLGMLEEL